MGIKTSRRLSLLIIPRGLMAVAGSEDALPGVRDNFYTNLLLLGFNPTQSEIKHKIVFNK